MEVQRKISSSTLLMMVMGLSRKVVTLDDSDVQRHELHWGYEPHKSFEVMVEVIVTRRELYTYIDGDLAKDSRYTYDYEFENISLFYMNMPIATDEQVENIVMPQLENLIELK